MNSFLRAVAYCFLALPGLLVMQAGDQLFGYGTPAYLLSLLLYAVVLFIVIAVHEAGHAFAARRFGWKIALFAIFPVAYRTKTKRLELWTLPSGDLGGAVVYSAGGRTQTPNQLAMVSAAGPLANFVLAVTALGLVYLLPQFQYVFGCTAVASFFTGLGNLLPWRSRGGAKSDGAVLLSAVKKRKRTVR